MDWNGDLESPTVSPSILVKASRGQEICHTYIKNGCIEFLADCTHELKGKTVPMEDATEYTYGDP
jgi:Family of unknown function (DUF6527)